MGLSNKVPIIASIHSTKIYYLASERFYSHWPEFIVAFLIKRFDTVINWCDMKLFNRFEMHMNAYQLLLHRFRMQIWSFSNCDHILSKSFCHAFSLHWIESNPIEFNKKCTCWTISNITIWFILFSKIRNKSKFSKLDISIQYNLRWINIAPSSFSLSIFFSCFDTFVIASAFKFWMYIKAHANCVLFFLHSCNQWLCFNIVK